jgi:hypothetical protein
MPPWKSRIHRPDRRYQVQKVYPGAYVLEVSTKVVTLLEQEIQVATTGQTTMALQIPVIHVTGQVIASSGAPLPKLNYIRLVRSGTDSDVFYGFPDAEGNFSFARPRRLSSVYRTPVLPLNCSGRFKGYHEYAEFTS